VKEIVSEQFVISLGNSAGTLDEDANINHFFETCKLFSKYFFTSTFLFFKPDSFLTSKISNRLIYILELKEIRIPVICLYTGIYSIAASFSFLVKYTIPKIPTTTKIEEINSACVG